jgi:hypothetical protein
MAKTDRRAATLIDQAREAPGRAATETEAATALLETLATAMEGPFEGPLHAPGTRAEILAAHRRAHRGGTLSKIASDPELAAFIAARIDTHTYAEVVAAVRSKFPADRQTSIAGVGRWVHWRAISASTGHCQT